MAKKPTEKQLYKLKNEWLGQFFEEVKPKEFYRAVFPEGSFERAGHFEDGKANGIITIVENDKAKNRIVFDDLSVIDEVKGAEFAVMSPVAYSGRNRTAANARWLYGTSQKTCRLAFNLWNGRTSDSENDSASPYYAVDEIFNCEYAPYYWQAIKLRYPQYTE